MGFNCLICTDRDAWGNESEVPFVCYECYIKHPITMKLRLDVFFRLYRCVFD